MADACVERGKEFSKEKHKRKLIKQPQGITCSFLAFWMIMESSEVLLKNVLVHDFPYQGILFNSSVYRIL